MKVRTCIITGHGINADRELAAAFHAAGSAAESVHIGDLLEDPGRLDRFQIIGVPGGFSFGDHLGSGKVFGLLMKNSLKQPLTGFVDRGGLIIGICNGFQVLVKMGILPNIGGKWEPEASLIANDSGVFEDSWVTAEFPAESRCVWTRGLESRELPIRHGEGRFVAASPEIGRRIAAEGLIAVRYAGRNPNGSVDGIAGICDRSGRILGLMPHPEAFLTPEHHPRWTRSRAEGGGIGVTGLDIFRRGVDYVSAVLK
jgi:phosphoribosylformylglycinamidine synthase